MTVKKSSLRKEIDSQFEVKKSTEDIDDFDNPIADAVQNLISSDIQSLNAEDISERFSSLRTRNFNDEVSGKSSSRKKISKDYFNSLDITTNLKGKKEISLSDSELEDYQDNEDDEDGTEDDDIEEKEIDEDEEDNDDDDNEDDDDDNEDDDDDDESEIEDDDYDIVGSTESLNEESVDDEAKNSNNVDSEFLYSKTSKSTEISKGLAVQQQISLWDTFLECRIRLQKSLIAFNKLPSQSILKELNIMNGLKKEFAEAQQYISKLLDTLIVLHEKLFEQSLEDSEKKLKRKSQDKKSYLEEGKKRKLNDYSEILKDMNDSFLPYRNDSIQKWNDKTKVAAGKMAKSNFSAFDQSILDQIGHILNDKPRLIKKTQQKKSKYQRVGERPGTKEDAEQVTDEYDCEIFDDDDFYHKILRDFIEKKTVDVNDPQKLGKQWMELQKLRSKMKKKVDTKCTKGRKLRYGVHEKLINFMAPIIAHQWNPESETELFKSLFGKRK